MTLRKTLIGVLASTLLLVGFAGQAVAQDTGTETTTDTTQTDTGTDTTTTDTTTDTGTDTTTTDTTDTGTDTTTTDTTTTETTTTETTDTTTDAGTDTTTDAGADATTGQGEPSIADSFATEAPNPQPGLPTETADPAAQAAPTAADQVLGESELAFTGPDTRVMGLAALLLGAGAMFVVASRRHDEALLTVDTWLE